MTWPTGFAATLSRGRVGPTIKTDKIYALTFRIPMYALIVDVETTGLDPNKDCVIEIGAILFDYGIGQPACSISFVLPCDENPVEHVNKIPAPLTKNAEPTSVPGYSQEVLWAMIDAADFVVAHNAAFDKKWLPQAMGKTWVCTMEDFPWAPELGLKGRFSLAALALAHGIPVWAQHRALTDCTYISQVFEKTEGLAEKLSEAAEPKTLYVANLPYARRQEAKDLGFVWNDPMPKQWSRRLTKKEAEEISKQFSIIPARAW